MGEQRKFIRWIKDHKKALIITGVSIATLIAVVLCIKNKEALEAFWASLRRVAEKPVPHSLKITSDTPITVAVSPTIEAASVTDIHRMDTFLVEVSRHPRNLPEGWHASPEKIAAAIEQNIVLEKGQTWVEAYIKGASAA